MSPLALPHDLLGDAAHGDPGPSSEEEHEERFERTFPVRGVVNLRVANRAGDTRIIASDDTTSVTIRARKYVRGATADQAAHLLQRFEISMDQEGDALVVSPHLPEEERSWRDSFRGRRVAVDFDITIPRVSGVEVNGKSGNVHLAGIHGLVSLQSVSGNMVLADLAGPLRLRTVSGYVRSTSYSGRCQCYSVSGDLRFGSSRLVDSELQTVSGDITFDGALDAGAVHRIGSVSGNVALGLVGASFEIEYKTLSGDLDCEAPAHVEAEGRRDRHVVLGAGEVRAQVKTVSGDLRIAVSEGVLPDANLAGAPLTSEPQSTSTTRSILERVAAGLLDPEQAAAELEMLVALPASPLAGRSSGPTDAVGTPSQRGRTLRVKVTESGAQKVNIAIPLAIARVGQVKLGGLVRGHLAKFGIDLDAVIRQAGKAGRIVDIADGSDRVEIFVD